jgi:hypothetical protein
MSLVTAQGLQARNEVDARIAEVRDALLTSIKQDDIALQDAFATFAKDSEQTVREAVWRLLNERKIEIISGTLLHLREA